jgi:hypothetical protein
MDAKEHNGNTPKLKLKLQATNKTYHSGTTKRMCLIITATLYFFEGGVLVQALQPLFCC